MFKDPPLQKRNHATICVDDSLNHIIYNYYYDYNSLALLQSNAQSSRRYAHIKERPLLSGKLSALKAQRQGGSIKNLLKPSLPNKSSVCFSGSLDFKNLGRITTGSTVDKKSIHICWFMFSAKLLYQQLDIGQDSR